MLELDAQTSNTGTEHTIPFEWEIEWDSNQTGCCGDKIIVSNCVEG